MIAFNERHIDSSGIINITSLVDIVFILLIFFMLTVNSSNGIVLDLPEASSGEPLSVESWDITLTEDEQLLFNGVEIDSSKLDIILKEAMRQDPTQRLVVLRSHRNASVNAFVSIMDSVRNTGFYNLVIATSIQDKQ